MKRKNLGIVIVFCVMALTMVSVIGVFFTKKTLLDRAGSQYVADLTAAKMAAYAGVDYCLVRLRQSCQEGAYAFSDWAAGSSSQPLISLAEPSYLRGQIKTTQLPILEVAYSGALREYQNHEATVYTCRITDNSCKININEASTERVQSMVTRLCQQLKIKDMGSELVSKRGIGYFNIQELKQALAMEDEIFLKIRPYLCTHSYSESVYDPISKNLQPCYPINLNAASREVLLAILIGVTGAKTYDNSTYILGESDAAIIVDAILSRRPFFYWDELANFLRALAEKEKKVSPESVSLAFSSMCPLPLPNAQNPNSYVRWSIDRLHLTKYYAPCTLAPGGLFHIETLGLVIQEDKIVAQAFVETDIQVFRQFIHCTQKDFCNGGFNLKAITSQLVPALSGPNPLYPNNGKSEGGNSIEGDRLPSTYPHEAYGAISRANGIVSDYNLHTKEMHTNLQDGALSDAQSLRITPWIETDNESFDTFALYFKPGPFFNTSQESPIFRNFSFVDQLGRGIATEINWHQEGYISTSRTLCRPWEVDYYAPRAQEFFVYKGILDPEGNKKIHALAAEIYSQNLEQDGSSIEFYLYSELGTKESVGLFAHQLAKAVYGSVAVGYPPDLEIELKMVYHYVELRGFLFFIPPVPPLFITVPPTIIWYINDHGSSEKNIVIKLSDYLPLLFPQGFETSKVKRSPFQGSLFDPGLHYLSPFPNPCKLGRSEYRVPVQLEQGKWYRLQLMWNGVEITKLHLVEGGTGERHLVEKPTSQINGPLAKWGTEDPNGAASPLSIWRIFDPTMDNIGEFVMQGTYLIADPMDFERYKNSYWQSTFSLPTMKSPILANRLVTAFVPYGCKITIKDISLEGYTLLLSGNPYLTPIVNEVRIRVLEQNFPFLFFSDGQSSF
ncbi:MAG: hypothetical protein HUU50_18760 [Candidatus Brocadiae bacterium]|nr:hypothetical protein [Candidatus Brocadiia bacterium]